MRLMKIGLMALVMMLCSCPALLAQTSNGSVSLTAADATNLGGILGILLAIDRLVTWWKNRNTPLPTPTPVPTPKHHCPCRPRQHQRTLCWPKWPT